MTQTTDTRTLVFRINWFWRGFFFLCLAGLVALGGFAVYAIPQSGGSLLLAISCGVGCLLAGGFMLLSGRCRVEAGPSEIVYNELLKRKVLPLEAVAGFRIVPTQYVKLLVIEPKEQPFKKMKIALIMERQAELLAWVKANLTDLDQAEYQQGLVEIYQNEQLAGTPEEKAARYQQAQKWCKMLRWLATAVCFWGILHPEPYSAAIWASVTMPFLGLLMLRRFEGIAKFNAPKNGAYPGVDVAIVLPCASLGLRAIYDWHVLEWAAFWAPFATISLALLGFALLTVRDIHRKASSFLLMALYAAAYGASATADLNGVLADGKASLYHAKVLAKHVSSGKNTTYYLRLAPWRNQPEDDAIVTRRVYESYEPGNTAEILVRTGKFGIPFYFIQLSGRGAFPH